MKAYSVKKNWPNIKFLKRSYIPIIWSGGKSKGKLKQAEEISLNLRTKSMKIYVLDASR